VDHPVHVHRLACTEHDPVVSGDLGQVRVDGVEWERLLRSQDRVASRAQALAYGWTARALAHRLQTGSWQRLVPGVLLTVSGEPTSRQLLRAGLLHAGPEAALAAATACRWHGLDCSQDDRVHVAVPARVRVRSTGFVRVHPTIRPLRVRVRDGLPVMPAPRAVVDAALTMTRENDVRALCAEAVQRRFASVQDLEAELAAAPSAGSALVRRVLAEVRHGARSAPEAALLRALRRLPGLPPYAFNVDVRDVRGAWLARPDVVFASVRVVVEVDGWRWHRDPERQRRDLERHTRLEAAGWTVLRYAASAVLTDPEAVAYEVARVVRARAAA
jgi:hypothetical protein